MNPMTNVKCVRCGVVNVVADEVCKVCGVELTPFRPPPIAAPIYRPDPDREVAAEIFVDIFEQSTTVLSLVIYLSILRTLDSRDSVIQ